MAKWTDLLGDISGSLRRRNSSLSIAVNHFSKDLTISSDALIFATLKLRIKHLYDPIESKMIDTRWKVFEFSFQIPLSKQKDLTLCPRCFSDLVLLEEMWAFHIFTSFAWFYFGLIYLIYSWLKQAVLAYSFTSSNIQ